MSATVMPPQPSRRHHPGRRSFAAVLAAAVIGASVSTGVLAATGSLRTGSAATTTTLVQTSAATGAAGALDAKAVYAAASPGVVDITAAGSGQTSPFGGGSSSSTATGSGFVADAAGHIVTAAHVVDGASSVKVSFADGTTRTATVVGKDDATDVAVLKVDPSGLTLHPLTLGSSSSLKVGDSVAAIGSPFGYQESFSTGIVSGLDRTIDAPNGFTVSHAIQTDAAINPGNSGGPILDANGRVIGIADQIATDGSAKQSSGVGFAVPIDLIKSEMSGLESGTAVRHAYLGVATSNLPGSTSGAQLGSVQSGGPAAAAGLRAGDVVTSIGGTKITGSGDLVAAIAAHQPGDHVAIVYRRGGSTRTATVTLGTQPAKAATAPAVP